MSALWTARFLLVLVVAMLVQATAGATIQVGGAHPDFLVAVVIGAALARGPATGAVVGFVAGVAGDLLVDTPFGLSAIAYVLVGYAAGVVLSEAVEVSGWLTPLAFGVSGGASVAIFAVFEALISQKGALTEATVRAILVVGVTNALISFPMKRIMSWALPPLRAQSSSRWEAWSQGGTSR
jgi:rod shape-determining protein MreD